MWNFIKENEEMLVEMCLLMPSFLASVNSHVVYDLLRVELTKDENKNNFQFSHLIYILDPPRIQQARHEQLVIKLASAYDGYEILFPLFIYLRVRQDWLTGVDSWNPMRGI